MLLFCCCCWPWGVGGWLLSSRYAQPYAKRLVREQLTGRSELVLAPFEVEFSIWRDFPHLTASLRHLTLSDSAHHRTLPVLRLGRADLRLNLRALLHRRVEVTRLTLHDVAIGQRVDSLGQVWGLRGKKQAAAAPPPRVNLALDSVIIYNFGIFTATISPTMLCWGAYTRPGSPPACTRACWPCRAACGAAW